MNSDTFQMDNIKLTDISFISKTEVDENEIQDQPEYVLVNTDLTTKSEVEIEHELLLEECRDTELIMEHEIGDETVREEDTYGQEGTSQTDHSDTFPMDNIKLTGTRSIPKTEAEEFTVLPDEMHDEVSDKPEYVHVNTELATESGFEMKCKPFLEERRDTDLIVKQEIEDKDGAIRGEDTYDREQGMSRYSGASCFPCTYCKFQTDKLYLLKRHLNKHTRERTFQCEHCDFNTAYKLSLKNHVNSKHTREHTIKCTHCEFTTTILQTMKMHINARHTKEEVFRCEYCDFSTVYVLSLKNHMRCKHMREDTTIKCADCDFTTTVLRTMKRHINAKHAKEKLFQCEHCDYSVPVKAFLEKHEISMHVEGKISCDECEFRTGTLMSLKRHISAMHAKAIVFRCLYCDYGTRNKSNFKTHAGRIHPKLPFKWEKCEDNTFADGDLGKKT